MKPFLFVSHLLLSLVATPITVLFAAWASIAESGGKDPHPEVSAVMLWGLVEVFVTTHALRRRELPSSTSQKRQSLRWGAVLVLGVVPLLLAVVISEHGREYSFLLPFITLIVGSRLVRGGLDAPQEKLRHKNARTLFS